MRKAATREPAARAAAKPGAAMRETPMRGAAKPGAAMRETPMRGAAMPGAAMRGAGVRGAAMRGAAMRGAGRAALLLLALAPLFAWAHGGEDHGAPPAVGAAAAAGARVPGTPFTFPKESQFLLGVRTARVTPRRIESRLSVTGKVVPRTDKHAQIVAPVPGRVMARGARLPMVGDHVRRGQVLAVLQQSLSAPESTQLASDRIRADSAAAQTKAALEQAQRDLARVQGLRGVVADKDVQQAQLGAQVAADAYARAQRERDLYAGAGAGGGGGRLAQFPLASPIDGVVVDAQPTVGEQVDTTKVLYTILDASVVWVEASVFADDVGRVEQAKDALVHVDAYPERWFPARLFNLGQMVDEATRTVKAVFEVRNGDGKLRPGLFADVEIAAGGPAAAEVPAVPAAAVVESDGRRFVYVHVAPEAFAAREVVLGARDGAFYAVRRGLDEGERVVVSGTYELRAAEGGRP